MLRSIRSISIEFETLLRLFVGKQIRNKAREVCERQMTQSDKERSAGLHEIQQPTETVTVGILQALCEQCAPTRAGLPDSLTAQVQIRPDALFLT